MIQLIKIGSKEGIHMKIKVKSTNHQSPLPGIIITIVFLGISLFIFSLYFVQSNYSFTLNGLIQAISTFGIIYLMFAIIFLCFSLYFIYLLISPPKKYIAILTEKTHINKGEKNYTKVTFETIKNEDSDNVITKTYKGLIQNDPDLTVKEKYLIGIKEFNWQLKYVTEYSELTKYKKHIPNMNLTPVIISVLSIFVVSAIGIIILGLITLKKTVLMGLLYIIFGMIMFISMIKYGIIFFKKDK